MVDCLVLERPPVSVPLSPLAHVLSDLRKRAGLSRRQLEMVSNVSEETIKAVEYGRNVRPTPETLRKLATGLATNRALGRVDADAAGEMLTELMRAAHYVPGAAMPAERPIFQAAPNDLPPDIVAWVRELVGTDEGQVRDLLADLAGRTDENRRAALRFLAQALELNRTSVRAGSDHA